MITRVTGNGFVVTNISRGSNILRVDSSTSGSRVEGGGGVIKDLHAIPHIDSMEAEDYVEGVGNRCDQTLIVFSLFTPRLFEKVVCFYLVGVGDCGFNE